MKPNSSVPPRRVRSMKELAIVTGIGYNTVKGYSKREGWPGRDIASGFYTVTACRDFMLANTSSKGNSLRSEDEQSTKEQIAIEDLRKKKTYNDEQDGFLVRKTDLIAQAAPTLQTIKDLLYQKLGNEMPTAMAEVDVPSARKIGTRYADELLLKFQELFRRWTV